MAFLLCGSCGYSKKVSEAYTGKRVKCPECQNGVKIKTDSDPTHAPPPEPSELVQTAVIQPPKQDIAHLQHHDTAGESSRSYLLTLQLSLFFGLFGIDRFYLGKIGTGFAKLAITLGTLFIAGGIWWLVDIFLLLYNKQTDAQGKRLAGQDKRDPIMLAYLSVFGGYFGLDRFYLNQTGLGIAKALTAGGLGIWVLIDLYLILSNQIAPNDQDAAGRPLEREKTKYQTVALLYAITGGFFGFDRFYLGHRSLGLLKMTTFGAFLIWYTLDIILIILNALKDSNGCVLVQE